MKHLKKIKVARTGYIIMSIIFYMSGIVYMLFPKISFWVLCIFSGMVLIVYGVIKIIGYFSDDLYCLAFQYDLAGGLFLIVLGGIVLGCNRRLSGYMPAGLGGLVLLDSLLTMQTAREAKQFGLKTWKMILVFSIVAGIFGALIIINPFQRIDATHVLVGVTLLAEGAMKHCVVTCTVKRKNKEKKER